jgi:hypothetical protein
VDNRVKLFEDGQSVKSAVKKLNMLPVTSSDTEDVANKSSKIQLQKQLALEDGNAAEKIRNVMNSRSTESTIYVTQNHLVNKQGMSVDLSDKAVLSSRNDLEKSERVPQHSIRLPKPHVEYASDLNAKAQVSASLIHKHESHRVKLPPGNKQLSCTSKLGNSTILRTTECKEAVSQVKLTPLPNGNEVNNWEVTNGIISEKEQASQETLQDEASSSGIALTDTLKAALKAPLPSGPPPKKPPRTFAHNTPSSDNVGENISVPCASATNAIEALSNKDLTQHVKFTKSVSEKTSVEKSVKPIRSKTESQIMLKKLESVLLNHEQGVGGVVLRPKSPMGRWNVEDKATVTYSEPNSNTGRKVGRVGPLPRLPLESKPLNSHDTSADGEDVRVGGCLNFTCVSADSNNPLYSQIHFYEKVPEKQSEFFVESPKICLPAKSVSKPYGTLRHCRSRSEEHIYAEPFDYFNRTQNHRHNLQDQKTPRTGMKNGESVGDLSKIGESVSLHSESRVGTLHYLVSIK